MLKQILILIILLLLPFIVFGAEVSMSPTTAICGGLNHVFAKVEEGYWTNHCSEKVIEDTFATEKGKELGKRLCETERENLLKELNEAYSKIKCPSECPLKIDSITLNEKSTPLNPSSVCEEGYFFGSKIACESSISFYCWTKEQANYFSPKVKMKTPQVLKGLTESKDKFYTEIKRKEFKTNSPSKESDKLFAELKKPVKVFGAEGSDEFGRQESDSNNVNNWPEKAKEMCKKAQDNALAECQAAAYHPGGWYVDRTIESQGTYKGKSINALISDQIVGQWDCPSNDLIVNEKGELIEQAKIYSELIDYTKMSREQKGGLPPDEEGLQITCHFACTAWPCPLVGTPKQNSNCEDHFFTDKDGDGKDDKNGRTKQEIIDRTINGKPTIEGGEYAGMKYVCEGEEKSWWKFWKNPSCKLNNCRTEEIPLAGDPYTTVIRVCCDCSCGQLMIPPNFDPKKYEPLTTDPFEGLFEPEKPKTPPAAPKTDESCEEKNSHIFFKAKDSKGKLQEGSVDKIMCDSFQGKDIVVNTFCVGNRFEATATPCKEGEKCENAKCVKQAVTQGLPKEGQVPNIFITDLDLYPEAIVGQPVHVIITLGGDPLAIDTLTSSSATEQVQINVILNGQEVAFYCEIGRTGRIHNNKYQCSTDAKGLVKIGNNLEVQLLYQGQIFDSKTSTFQGKETSSITGYQTIDVFNNKNLACAINVVEV